MNESSAASPDRLLDLFHGVRLTPTQRRIAHCLVRHAGAAAYLSAAEVAELAGVSQPSVTRFAMALGHDGYPALRRRLRELTVTGSAGPAAGNALQRAVHAERDNLDRLAAQLADAGRVAEVGKLLAASRPLPVLGLRAAAPLAAYFAYFAAKVHPDVRVLDDGGSMLVDRLDQAVAAGATAMLAFVLPRYPRETLDALREARDAGLTVVAITDSPVSPATEHAEVVLPAAVGADLVFDLHTAPMTLAMVVLQAICDAAPAETQNRLEAFESSAARRQLFLG
ncbi:MurR/RpiR family transcriptional regulator [Micromonospora aurantiaca]|uniref:MurR/RpiR family transcriptional regulator n=1 Tax=Micromonospora aurantiaca (nom. illeg.) TaxID=47850 RepID=A0A1C6T0B8_9ACTN|nr:MULTISPECIES: MurR/RpiR family transcriptional regulator [Micromonospora]ADU06968.1 transcriptional regulator, RpiR family [Micromonospora sp. L5]AXH90912.1 MurR/RpiR family transcriptional regulator [Micromonospora aurantiaca]KAB1113032.1 MurR/RpiR family transcriptional regulator [Micromonospora aurantiaca]RNI00300.1 MurR/RpiR family transcriptional regulator [Micromonospora aurantiaca]UFN95738.1 MurR/RpiR family transcriptional regulator [Micromonospora aurantiaca]